MNRIILIGNGFDLAQDLKNSYKNFMEDYSDKKSTTLIEIFRRNKILHSDTIPLKNYEDDDIIVEITNNNSILHDNNGHGITGFNRFKFIISQLFRS